MTKIKEPRLRFSEFSGEWKKEKLDNIAKVGDGLHGTPNYSDNGQFAFINGNNLRNSHIFIDNSNKYVKYTELENVDKAMGDNTLLISLNGTVGNISIYNNEKVMLSKSTGFINLNNSDRKFILYYLSTYNIQKSFIKNVTGTTIKNLSLRTLKNTTIGYTSKIEQQKIGDFFVKQDKLIELQTQKVEQLNKLKRGYLQNMFPQEGEIVPRLRFSGFSGDWKEEKLDSLLSECSNREVKNAENHKLLKVSLHFKGVKTTTDHPRVTSKGRKYFLREPGDLIIGKQNFHNGGFAIIPDNVEGYVASSAIVSFTNKGNCNLNFVNFYMMNNDWLRRTTIFIGGTGQKEYSVKTLKSLKIKIPTLEEQEKISKFFKVIDNKMEYEKGKLNRLNKLKKAYLQKMFV